MMNEQTLRRLIAENNLKKFYKSREWKRVRMEVLASDRFECQGHKARGEYARATTVHHVKHVLDHPELALSKFYTEHGAKKRQLISLCHNCHEEEHGHRHEEKKLPLTEERW